MSRLLTFHPNSTFSDVSDDPADFALRSPFPTILVLRGTDVREAEDLCDIQGRVTEDIAIANEARLRTVGYEKLRDIFQGIMNSCRNGESARELAMIQAERQAAITQLVEREEYESDGFDGLKTSRDPKDPIGSFALPPPADLEARNAPIGKNVEGEGGDGQEGLEEKAKEGGGVDEEERKRKLKETMSEPFNPLGYEPGM